LHVHQGTAVTHFHRAGFTDEEVVEMVGWKTEAAKQTRPAIENKLTLFF